MYRSSGTHDAAAWGCGIAGTSTHRGDSASIELSAAAYVNATSSSWAPPWAHSLSVLRVQQLPQSSKRVIRLVSMAGTRIAIQVVSAHTAKSQAIRPAKGRQRKVQNHLVPDHRFEIDIPVRIQLPAILIGRRLKDLHELDRALSARLG